MNLHDFYVLLNYPENVKTSKQRQLFIQKIIDEKADSLDNEILHQAIINMDLDLVSVLVREPFDFLTPLNAPYLTLYHNKTIVQLCDIILEHKASTFDSSDLAKMKTIQDLIIAVFEKQKFEQNIESVAVKTTFKV